MVGAGDGGGGPRVALVTGAASGMGRAVAGLLAERGDRVVALDVNGDGLEGVGSHRVVADLADIDGIAELVGGIRRDVGPISVLANVAGVSVAASFDDPDYASAYDRAMTVNLASMVALCRASLADLIADGAGRIVNVASTEGLAPQRFLSPYAISKHGVIGLTRSLAVEVARHGVTANCVCPGPILTGMTDAIPGPDRERFARRHVPVGRYGRPEEVAHMVAALADRAASFVNGAIIPVDGGMTAGT
jgi:3-oxoacyl-[acyl-carrier protein] reductase